MQFSDIAVSERLAFENSSFYLRPQGTALVISSSQIWRRSKGYWHFFFRKLQPKKQNVLKTDPTHMLSISLTMKWWRIPLIRKIMLTLAEFVLVLCSDGKKSGGGGARKKNRKQKKGPRSTSKTSTDAVEAVGDRRPSGTATQVSETNDVATSSFDLPWKRL